MNLNDSLQILRDLEATPTLLLFVLCTLVPIISILTYFRFRDQLTFRVMLVFAFAFVCYMVHIKANFFFGELNMSSDNAYQIFAGNLSVDMMGTFVIPVIILFYLDLTLRPLWAFAFTTILGALILFLCVMLTDYSDQLSLHEMAWFGTDALINHAFFVNLGLDVVAGMILPFFIIIFANVRLILQLRGCRTIIAGISRSFTFIGLNLVALTLAGLGALYLANVSSALHESLVYAALGALVSALLIESTLQIAPDRDLTILMTLGIVILVPIMMLVIYPDLIHNNLWQTLAPELLGSLSAVLILEGDKSDKASYASGTPRLA